MLQWGHDLAVVESRNLSSVGRRERQCFNGATTSRSWNLEIIHKVKVVKVVLQWGHDLAVVESSSCFRSCNLT